MPITAFTFVFGWLAIAGVIPFAGFWSKDEILAKVWFSGNYALWAVGLTTALITAYYMTRQVWLVFFTDERWSAGASALPVVSGGADDEPAAGATAHDGDSVVREPHESPWTMTVPLVALAGLTLLGGGFNLPFTSQHLERLAEWLHPVFEDVPEIHTTSFAAGALLSFVALVVAACGIVVGRAIYRRGLTPAGADPGVERLGAAAPVLEHAYYLDDGVAAFVGGPGKQAAEFLADGVDARGIDGAVNGVAAGFRVLAGGLRRLQTGYVRNYALGIVLGSVLLLLWFGTRGAL
jgi:NADH-quinone oxidoreductase subunit L